MLDRCLGCMEEYESDYGLCPLCGYEPDTGVESPIHMQPGVMLHGRYLVGRVLGYGGFGVTYIGWDYTLQQKVAIKEYLPSELATRMSGQTQVTVFGGNKQEQFGDGMSQFVQEARSLAQFHNEDGVVRVYDSFAENNTAYIVMEFLEGETLTSYLERNGQLSEEDAVAMLVPVLQSLEVVHKTGTIHRDIAPDNIFLTKDGSVKLIDFGAARYASSSHSRSLSVIIKPGYSPEEQYRSRGDQGPHTDVYAIAAVLYRMVTGVTPPDSMERRASCEKNGKDPLLPPSKHCKISKSRENAIMNALNIRVEDRTPTAAKLLEELVGEEPVKRVVGKIRTTGGGWPLWLKILLPVAGVAAVVLLILLATGVIGPARDTGGNVSLSQNEARVPSVVNCSVDVAQAMLAELGLDCQIVGTEYSDSLPANVVLYQSIAAGQVVEKDTVIGVYISTDEGGAGIVEGQMPYVQYKSKDEAVALLESMGLIVDVEEVYSNDVPEGMVVSQSLDPDAEIQKGDQVTLQVSKGADPDAPSADSQTVTLLQDSFELYLGDSVPMVAQGGDGTYTYESSDPAVLTVTADGTVTAVGAGTATITVRSGTAKEASCTVTVSDYEMALSPGQLTLFIDGYTVMSVSGIPTSARLEWVSADPKVATVDAEGKVVGVSSGKTTVTVTWANGEKLYTATAAVEVNEGGIALSENKIGSFYVGQTRKLTATTSPADQKVSWSSSNEKVVKVSADGKLTAVGGGTATVTATFGEFSATCKVTVTQPSVSLTKSSLSLTAGGSERLSATVIPNGTAVKWSSDDTSVAKVSDGKVTAVAAGTTTIRVKMTYEGKTYEDTCKVTVTKKASSTTKPTDPPQTQPTTKPTEPPATKPAVKPSVSLDKSSVSLFVGQTRTLTATVKPSGTSVSWSSSDTSVAKVSSSGKITAVAAGSATITAKITSGGSTYKATCKVTVSKPTISVSSSASTIEFSQRDNGTCTVTATVAPDGSDITWTSSDNSVATVSGSGKTATVTAKAAGSVTITATYKVSGTSVTDSCTINVQRAASSLKVVDLWCPASGTCDSFRIQGKIISNYQIDRMTCTGSATSNALGIKVSDTADPLYVGDGVFEYDLADATQYFIEQYEALYDLYAAAAGLFGADNSVTMDVVGTVYDDSGNSFSFNFQYVIYED